MEARPPEGQSDLDEKMYSLARSYLLSQEGISQELLDRHLRLSLDSHKPAAVVEVYERLLRSAQSAQSMPNVIGGSIGGIERLGTILYGFEPAVVAEKYPRSEAGCKRLFDNITGQLEPRGKLNYNPRSLWRAFAARSLRVLLFSHSFSMRRLSTSGLSRSTWTRMGA